MPDSWYQIRTGLWTRTLFGRAYYVRQAAARSSWGYSWRASGTGRSLIRWESGRYLTPAAAAAACEAYVIRWHEGATANTR